MDYLDWLHCDLSTTHALVTFHSSDNSWVKDIKHVKIEDSAGVVVADVDTPSVHRDYPMKISYLTTMDNFATAVIHLQNHDSSNSYEVNTVYLNGQPIVANQFKVNIGNSYIITHPFASPVSEGEVWVVEFETSDGMRVGNGVRAVKEKYVF